ncbi:MAG: fluoride efflux transporter CrcB [Bacteroidota bacterium]
MLNYLFVFVGGGIGASARYWLGGIVHERYGSDFPYGTLVVNVVGCFLIGVLMVTLEERFLGSPHLRIFLTIGILGGFTTFSSFSYETMAMLRDGEFFFAALNVAISVATCLAGTWLGMQVGKLF